MENTHFPNGSPQYLYYPDGRFKGIVRILKECRFKDIHTLNLECKTLSAPIVASVQGVAAATCSTIGQIFVLYPLYLKRSALNKFFMLYFCQNFIQSSASLSNAGALQNKSTVNTHLQHLNMILKRMFAMH
jgi:hypothetical protein